MSVKIRIPKSTEIVLEIFNRHPDWTESAIYEEYNAKILKYPDDVHKKLERKLNAIQKQVHKLRVIYKGEDLERPWSLGTLHKHPVPTSSISSILKVQEYRKSEVTCRQAIWISYLHEMVQDIGMLSFISSNYADFERASILSGKEVFDSAVFDRLLLDNTNNYEKLRNIFGNNLFYLIDVDEENITAVHVEQDKRENIKYLDGVGYRLPKKEGEE